MLTPQLLTFIKTAQCRSFSKAAQKLYISRVSVMRHIDALEAEIGVQLLVRGSSGVSLTPAGQSLYEDALRIQADSEMAIRKARSLGMQDRCIIRVGASLLNPCNELVSLWEEIREEYPRFRLRIVPFSDDHEKILDVISSFRSDHPELDVLLAANDSTLWQNSCRFLPFRREPIVCAVPISHPLASRERLSVRDLDGQQLMMVSGKDAPGNARARELLERECRELSIISVGDYYDIDVFHTCVDRNCLLLSLPVWESIHPALVHIPIDWNCSDCSVPFGLMFPKRPSAEVLTFVDAISGFFSSEDLRGRS